MTTALSLNLPLGPFSSKYDWAWKVLERNADLDEFVLFGVYADNNALMDALGSLSVQELAEIVSDFRESHE